MSKLNDVKYILRKDGHGTRKQIWSSCPVCGLTRWVFPQNSGICRPCCARQKGINLRIYGKRIVDSSTGYVRMRLFSDEPFYSMANKNHWVFEHRLVMAKFLNRVLLPTELVHHLNGVRVDNRIENLVLCSTRAHEHKTLVKVQAKRIKELEDELSELQKRYNTNTL